MSAASTPRSAKTPAIQPLAKRKAWAALKAHAKKIHETHLRQLFDDDPKRGERFFVDAAGIYFDYSKNRIDDKAIQLLLDLARESGLRRALTPCFAATRSTSPKIAPCCTWPSARRRTSPL
jgi:glucose-6-phosphate isomerase